MTTKPHQPSPLSSQPRVQPQHSTPSGFNNRVSGPGTRENMAREQDAAHREVEQSARQHEADLHRLDSTDETRGGHGRKG